MPSNSELPVLLPACSLLVGHCLPVVALLLLLLALLVIFAAALTSLHPRGTCSPPLQLRPVSAAFVRSAQLGTGLWAHIPGTLQQQSTQEYCHLDQEGTEAQVRRTGIRTCMLRKM